MEESLMKKIFFLFSLLGLCSLGSAEAATYYSSSQVVEPIYTYPNTYQSQVQRSYYYTPNVYNYSQNLPSNYYNVTRYPSNYISNPYDPYYDYNEYDYPGNYPYQGTRDYQYYSYPDQGYYYNSGYRYTPVTGYTTTRTVRTTYNPYNSGSIQNTTDSVQSTPGSIQAPQPASKLGPSGAGTLNY